MDAESNLERVLVIVEREDLKPGAVGESAVIQRALELARKTGCEIELFHLCRDESLEHPLFAAQQDVIDARAALADRAATAVAEIAVEMNTEGIAVRHAVCWDQPRTDALLRKIGDTNPDIVLKQSREHHYAIGLFTHPDWELIRRSPSHVWFVKPEIGDIDTLVTAIGSDAPDEPLVASRDYDVYRYAEAVSRWFDAGNVPVHAYRIPESLAAYSSYAPVIGGAPFPADESLDPARSLRRVAEEHGNAIREFAEQFGLDPDRVVVKRGRVADVLENTARETNAGLMILGARDLSRWERFVESVSAEPVLARVACDVLFVRRPDETEALPETDPYRTPGVPVVDPEQAIINPGGVFHSPAQVATEPSLSIPFRQRILDAWESDVNAQLVATDEGVPPRAAAADADTLKAISSARRLLGDEQRRDLA